MCRFFRLLRHSQQSVVKKSDVVDHNNSAILPITLRLLIVTVP